MGKQSTRKNKTIYQICREAQGLTREKAAELMDGISDSKIEKIEYELQEPTPYDIVQMADCYKRPDLCNYYCSHKCAIGERYVPEERYRSSPALSWRQLPVSMRSIPLPGASFKLRVTARLPMMKLKILHLSVRNWMKYLWR